MTIAPTIFRQRRFGVRVDFEFRGDDFGYGIRDIGGGKGVAVAYEAVDPDARSTFTISNSLYLMRWMILPYMATLSVWVLDRDFNAFPFVLAGLGSTLILFIAGACELTAVNFTEIATFGTDAQGVRGFIRIIRDRQHDAVIDELSTRWRTRMRAIAGAVDLAADPTNERARLAWLRDRGVLSDVEYQWAIDQLTRDVDEGHTAH